MVLEMGETTARDVVMGGLRTTIARSSVWDELFRVAVAVESELVVWLSDQHYL